MAKSQMFLAFLLGTASATSPRPPYQQVASYARWLIHESDYGTVFTHHNGKDVFGNIISTCDGDGSSDSTGILYTYLPGLDATAHDLTQDPRVSVTFTEKAVVGNTCNHTAEDPPCGRVTINGNLTLVPVEEASKAEMWFKKCHPQGYAWGVTHSFKPYWIDPKSITDMFVIDFYGGAKHPTVAEYLNAPWHGAPTPTQPPTPAPALNPRPWVWQGPEMARWLVHESDFAVIGTHHNGKADDVFGNIISISDGRGSEDSTGIIYTYIPSLDSTYQDVMADSRVSITLSEKPLASGKAPGCRFGTAESPPCVRLTIQGRLTPVPEANKTIALQSLFKRHPEMVSWGGAHDFSPFWLAPENITEFFLIPFYGGAVHFSVEDYLNAPWYSGGPAPSPVPIPRPHTETWACSECGHVYDADADGAGMKFEDLAASWKCPVCGYPKNAYKKITMASSSDSATELQF